MYHLEQNNYLYFLLLIPILIALFAYNQLWKKKKQLEFGDFNLVKKLIPNYSNSIVVFKFSILVLGIILLIISLSNPRYGTKTEKIKREGIDIVFAIDVSKSMLAEDIVPSRIEKSKQIINQIINRSTQDRIGIIAYAANAFPILPMTTDYSAGKMYVEGINTDMISSQGTALKQAIEQASYLFNEESNSKIIILLSDGEDHGSSMEDAIETAKEKGIKIISVGVGTENGAKIPIKLDGNLIDYKKDNDGQIVISKLNRELLKEIAEETNATYFELNNTQNIVSKISSFLDQTEKNEAVFVKTSEYKSHYQWFLAIGFILLIIEFFIPEGKTNWKKLMKIIKPERK